MSGKHTPGPWSVGAQNDTLFITAGRSPSAVDVDPWHDAPRVAVAKIMRPADGDALPVDELANAHLISAAPDLLEVVKRGRRKLATYTAIYTGDKELRGLLEAWDAAIVRALGGAS
jgi:hypothetical protein